MTVIEVRDKQTSKKFLHLPLKIYRDEPNWIRPLDKDINDVFDPKMNKTFRHGECIRWILKDDSGQTIGRIAAFINKKIVSRGNDQPTGSVGFFECIDDQDAANLLFDTGKKWLEDKGMEAMDGPVNFGQREAWWGLLVDGHDIEPNYRCNYHLPYYRGLFENYGFQLYFNQFTFGLNVFGSVGKKLLYKAGKAMVDPEYSFRHFEKKKWKKYAEDFRDIYNKAWAKRRGVAQMSSIQAKTTMKSMLPIIDEKLIWFGYHKEEPVVFSIKIPEVNQIFKHVNGKMNWIGKLIFLYHKVMKTNKKILGLAFGIAPKHQGKGVDGALVKSIYATVVDKYKRYSDFEMNWIGDFNPKMMRVAEQLNAKVVKTHITYRYLFDRTKPYERLKIE